MSHYAQPYHGSSIGYNAPLPSPPGGGGGGLPPPSMNGYQPRPPTIGGPPPPGHPPGHPGYAGGEFGSQFGHCPVQTDSSSRYAQQAPQASSPYSQLHTPGRSPVPQKPLPQIGQMGGGLPAPVQTTGGARYAPRPPPDQMQQQIGQMGNNNMGSSMSSPPSYGQPPHQQNRQIHHQSTPSSNSSSESSAYAWSQHPGFKSPAAQMNGDPSSSSHMMHSNNDTEIRQLSPAERAKLTLDDVIVPDPEPLGPCPNTVEEIAMVPGNSECADCTTANPDWVSINLGIFICMDCAGVHRSLGTDYSKVRSLQLDNNWQNAEVVQLLHSMGNERSKQIYERCVPSFYIRPSSLPRDASGVTAVRENWIKAKYMRKEFVSPRGVDESKDSATIFSMPEPVLEGNLSTQSGNWRHKWQKRWFVLYHRYLLYYPGANYSTASGRYDVTEMTYDLADNEAASNTFVLKNSGGKEFPLIAESTHDMFMWIHALRRASLFYTGPQSRSDRTDSVAMDSMTSTKLKQARHSGYLVKQGGDVKSWKRRYFVILGNVLYYFKLSGDPPDLDSGKEVKPKGYIHLSNCEVTSNGTQKTQPSKPNCFCVFTPDRQYFMCADSQAIMQEWVGAIEDTIAESSRRVRVDFKSQGHDTITF